MTRRSSGDIAFLGVVILIFALAWHVVLDPPSEGLPVIAVGSIDKGQYFMRPETIDDERVTFELCFETAGRPVAQCIDWTVELWPTAIP